MTIVGFVDIGVDERVVQGRAVFPLGETTLYDLAARHDVHWRWVRGHAGVDGNERADELANRGVESVAAARRSG